MGGRTYVRTRAGALGGARDIHTILPMANSGALKRIITRSWQLVFQSGTGAIV